MKSYRQELWFEVPRRRAFLTLTPQIATALAESGIREGLCLVNAWHPTATGCIAYRPRRPNMLLSYTSAH